MIGPTPLPRADLDVLLGEQAARPARGYWAESWQRIRANRVGMACAVIIVLLALVAVVAPVITGEVLHQDPLRQNLRATFQPPGPSHWLGTDELGRDTLARLLGLVAGFYGGALDLVLMRFVDMVLSIPSIYLLILLTVISPRIGPVHLDPANPVALAVIIALVGWGGLARLVRGEVLSVNQRDFMLATRSLGAGDLRLILRHLLPNVLAVMIVAASLGVGGIILTEAALDYIGLGIQPPTPSWGNMLFQAQTYFYHSTLLVVLPGLCIFATVLAMNLLGNALRDAFDPRLR